MSDRIAELRKAYEAARDAYNAAEAALDAAAASRRAAYTAFVAARAKAALEAAEKETTDEQS